MRRSNILQIVGYKNSGKTTLLCSLVEELSSRGLKVATLKHDAHEFQMDRPDTDTSKHQQAGAWLTAISSPTKTAWIKAEGTELDSLLESTRDADVVLVEGFKQADYPKIAMLRGEEDCELLAHCSNIVAVYSPYSDSPSPWLLSAVGMNAKAVFTSTEHSAKQIIVYLEEKKLFVW
jgi:molybdopterin-guanine dinucleotide biosynthesis protein B